MGSTMTKRFAVGLAALFLFGAAPVLAGPVETLMERSQAAEAKGKFDEAVVLMQAAVVASPDRAETYVALADLYVRRNDVPTAGKYYDEALGIDPTLASALLGAGRIDLAQDDRAGAKGMLARLEKICGPDCAETRALSEALAAGKNAEADATPSSLDKQ